jgi:hypothetical protein
MIHCNRKYEFWYVSRSHVHIKIDNRCSNRIYIETFLRIKNYGYFDGMKFWEWYKFTAQKPSSTGRNHTNRSQKFVCSIFRWNLLKKGGPNSRTSCFKLHEIFYHESSVKSLLRSVAFGSRPLPAVWSWISSCITSTNHIKSTAVACICWSVAVLRVLHHVKSTAVAWRHCSVAVLPVLYGVKSTAIESVAALPLQFSFKRPEIMWTWEGVSLNYGVIKYWFRPLYFHYENRQ